MQADRDAASSGTGSGTTLNWAHTSSGTGRLIIVFAGGWECTGKTASGTHDGVALVPIASASIIGGGGDGVYAFGLIDQAVGANTIEITFSGSITGATGGAVSFKDADQSTGWGTGITGSGASATPAIALTSALGEYCVDSAVFDQTGSKTIAPHASQLEEWDVVSSGEGCAGSTEIGATSVSMDWVISSAGNWVQGGVAVLPGAEGAPLYIAGPPLPMTQRSGG